MPPTTVHVVAPTARLSVQDYGGGGEPVLLLHGGPGCPDYLAPVAQMLAPGRRSLTFDQRGVGRSATTKPTFLLDDYLADISAIRTYFGCESLHLFGHGWGGLLAQLYARREPARVRSLFLCNSALGVGEEWRATERALMRHIMRQARGPRALDVFLSAAALSLPRPAADAAARRLFAAAWRGQFEDPRVSFPPPPGWLAGVNARALTQTARCAAAASPALLHWTDAPAAALLVLYGREGYDPLSEDAGPVVRRFPSARRVVLRGSGHLPWIQDPEAFRSLLHSFYP